jgi:hypothetical protein
MAAVAAACSQASTAKPAAAAVATAAMKPLLQLLYNVAMTWLWPLFTASSQGYECLQRVLKDGALSLDAVSDTPTFCPTVTVSNFHYLIFEDCCLRKPVPTPLQERCDYILCVVAVKLSVLSRRTC